MNFSGYFIFNPGEDCGVAGNIANLNCTGSGASLVTVANWSNAIEGQVTFDLINPYSTGSATWSSNLFPYTNIDTFNRWNIFDNFFRGWGINAALGSAKGYCGSSSCRIWDMRAKSTGPAYNVSYNGTSPNGTLNTDGNACGANTVVGTDTITAASKTFLKNAVEIDGDRIGNDNGLCEASENCLWAPNIGAYQGSGSRSSGYCTVSGGIKIYKYTTN